MNTKKYEGCDKPHRRNGYCANHSQKFKRGTLYLTKEVRLCSVKDCKNKHYSLGLCSRHYRQYNRQKYSKQMTELQKDFAINDFNYPFKQHDTLTKAAKHLFGDKCMLCCWNETTCDMHHIVDKAKGGSNSLANAV